MNENCVEIASLVRQIVLDTLKTSAPGIAEQMRNGIANSVSIKVRHYLVPSPTLTQRGMAIDEIALEMATAIENLDCDNPTRRKAIVQSLVTHAIRAALALEDRK